MRRRGVVTCPLGWNAKLPMNDTPETPTSPPTGPASPPPERASFWAVNWRVVAIVGGILPVGALAMFAAYASNAAIFGAVVGWCAAMIDAIVTGIFVARGVANPHSNVAFKALGIGFMARLILIALGYFALMRVPALDSTAFALAYVATHFASIVGWTPVLRGD